jgi:hypothetical protein
LIGRRQNQSLPLVRELLHEGKNRIAIARVAAGYRTFMANLVNIGTNALDSFIPKPGFMIFLWRLWSSPIQPKMTGGRADTFISY